MVNCVCEVVVTTDVGCEGPVVAVVGGVVTELVPTLLVPPSLVLVTTGVEVALVLEAREVG